MGSKELLEEALLLNPQERYLVVESLLKSLDKPDEAVDEIWAEEAQKRLDEYRKHKVQTIPFEQIFD